ncbi:MAG: pyridoxamine 5'-phosphate oxidase family protein, partial [Pseudomonadota bacterium]|nr:pyridoxamine 5'-phosphate oxidase family protein [Pseudomonadota bacterium]
MGTEDKTSFDASHRAGASGFVEVDGPDRLRFPDYAGNNYFNTIGNLLCDPRIGLLFIDFGSGGMLQMTGRAEIVWHGRNSRDPEAHREVVVTIDQVVERSGALALRWGERAANRRLKIARKVDEGGAITSFYLEPADGKPLPTFAAGQHLPIALDVPDIPIPVRRTYSLSGPVSDKTLRISVKREARGIASAHLHDRLEPGDEFVASPPAGDFVVPHGQGPLVLASAGVGVTPMLAMLHALAKKASPRKIWFVQGVRDGNSHAFKDEVARLQKSSPDIEVQTYISSPRPTDLPLPSGVVSGRMTASDLRALGAGEEAHYMLCGPSSFISDLGAGLESLGVPAGQIHYESFGPSG